jgi:hypothetical protein
MRWRDRAFVAAGVVAARKLEAGARTTARAALKHTIAIALARV